MKRLDKEQFVTDFRGRLDESSVLYLTDFTGLDVKSITTLRRTLKQNGAEFLVVKNRLAKRALAELDLPNLEDHLRGPTGFVLANAAAEPAKAITDFARAHGDRPVFKVGILDAELIDAAAIAKIATLPPRDQLLAEVAGVFQAPMAAMASVLGALTQEMAGLIEALRDSRN